MQNEFYYNYIENFVDMQYANGTDITDDSFEDIALVFEEYVERDFVRNADFERLIQCIYLPEKYPVNSSQEKLYAKLIETVVAIWSERVGLGSDLVTKNSGVEDVRIIIGKYAILCDTKTYRLSRSQKAPNVKDFVQMASMAQWISNYNTQKNEVKAIGGLITYTKSHEWNEYSDVYMQCSNMRTPILMLNYQNLALLLHFSEYYEPNDLLILWDYPNHFPEPTNNRHIYWKTIFNVLTGQLLKDVPDGEILKYSIYMDNFVNDLIKYQYNRLNDYIEDQKYKISQSVEQMSLEELRDKLILSETDRQLSKASKSLEYIKRYRLDG